MNSVPVSDEDDLHSALQRLEELSRGHADGGEADEMDALLTLVQACENARQAIGTADPVAAIESRMRELGLAAKDLDAYLGGSARVAEVLERKRKLSLRMIKRLHDGLQIPYASLLSRSA